MKHTPLDLSRLKTYSLSDRKSKASFERSARPFAPGGTFREFVEGLPSYLAADDLRSIAKAIAAARRQGRPVVLGMGAHAIKVGLSPLIIELIRSGVITALATNGACIIHDFEMAYIGRTSEDVAAELETGAFGMARETGKVLNEALTQGVGQGLGIGASVGAFLAASDYPHRAASLFGACFRAGIPATVHVTVGADIIHMHPEADGSSIGEGSLRDFRTFASVVAGLKGGVYLNLGSAVVLPEVFLKALSMARNLGADARDFTTVNMDFIQHYRPRENVLKRPTLNAGRSYALTGHHEIMFPLLAALIVEEL